MRPLILILSMLTTVTGASLADQINGRIKAINLNDKTIEISGVEVIADGASVQGEAGSSIVLSDLDINHRVEVTGSLGNGRMWAKKIQKVSAGYDKVAGNVSSVNGNAKKINIGGIDVKVPNNATLEDSQDSPITFDKLIPGNVVQCKGLWTGPREFMSRSVKLQ